MTQEFSKAFDIENGMQKQTENQNYDESIEDDKLEQFDPFSNGLDF